jgi:tetratricopeptide (TPR) repeat protein/tRNA A-37 threonylcarbamoyl transferase component Bud32
VATLGEGGSGVVYLAEADDGARFAIKTIRPDLFEHRAFVESLRREARLCSRLDHPGIVKVLELGEHDGEVYLRMEHVDGASLERLLAGARGSRRRLPAGVACHVARELARALAHAHALRDDLGRPLGIVHRDVNPANIMITRAGAVKLLDFGIATAAEHLRDRRTGSGQVKGTFGYLSPEQADGRRVDGRSDLFALGVVLYEALTGVSLFRGRNAIHSLRLLTGMQVLPPSRLCPELDPRLDGVIQALLAVDPDHRPPDGNAVARALVPLVATDGAAQLAELVARLPPAPVPARARRSHQRSSARPWWGRRWTAVAGLAIALPLLALGARALRRPPAISLEAVRPSPVPPPTLVVRDLSDASRAAKGKLLGQTLGETLAARLVQRGHMRLAGGDPGAELVLIVALHPAPAGGGHVQVDVQIEDTYSGQGMAAASAIGHHDDPFALVEQLTESLDGPVKRHAARRAARQAEAARWYDQGMARLRLEDCAGARPLFDRALAVDPRHALAHVARGRCWLLEGDAARAWQEANRARALSAGLDRERQLTVAGFGHEAAGQWPAAVATYTTLFEFFPDRVDHGLALVAAMEQAGRRRLVGPVLERLRALPGREDPRIYLAEVGTGCGRDELLAQARLARDKARSQGAEVLAAGAQLAEAWTLIRFSGCAEARPVWQEARRVFQRAGRPRDVLKLDRFESRCLREEGQVDQALEVAQRNLAAMRKLEDPDVTERGLRELAETLAALGRRSEARRYWEEALVLARNRDSYPGAALALDGLAALRASEGDLRGAIRFAQQAVESRAPERGEDAVLLARQSAYHLEAGELAEARDLAERALIAARLTRGPRAVEASLLASSAALQAAGRLDEARRAADESRRLVAPASLSELRVEAQLELAEIDLAAGNPAAAAEAARAALPDVSGRPRTVLAARVHELLARVELVRGRIQAARQEIDRASTDPPGGFPFAQNARLEITRARVEAAEGDLKAARARLLRTADSCRRSFHVQREGEARALLRQLTSGLATGTTKVPG